MSGFIGKVGLLQAGVADGSGLALTLVAAGVVASLLTLIPVARVWTRSFWRPLAATEPAGDEKPSGGEETAGRAAAGEDEPGAAGGEDGASPTAWERHQAVALATHPDDDDSGPTQISDRPLPRLMVAATAGMVAVTLGLTVVAGPLYGMAGRAAADLLDRSPYIEAVLGEGGGG
jgi:multicomponent Na+:H+ antiporter subunit D